MKFYFFDTSALVKRYHSEKGTENIDKIFIEDDRAVIISSLSITEIVSAMNRKKEEKVISIGHRLRSAIVSTCIVL